MCVCGAHKSVLSKHEVVVVTPSWFTAHGSRLTARLIYLHLFCLNAFGVLRAHQSNRSVVDKTAEISSTCVEISAQHPEWAL